MIYRWTQTGQPSLACSARRHQNTVSFLTDQTNILYEKEIILSKLFLYIFYYFHILTGCSPLCYFSKTVCFCFQTTLTNQSVIFNKLLLTTNRKTNLAKIGFGSWPRGRRVKEVFFSFKDELPSLLDRALMKTVEYVEHSCRCHPCRQASSVSNARPQAAQPGPGDGADVTQECGIIKITSRACRGSAKAQS